MDKKAKGVDIKINRIEKAPDIPSMVVNQVVELIGTGILKVGDRLPSELEMTRRFGISRISLREAMKLLEAKGFIESQGRKGKYVRSVVDNAIRSPIEGLISVDHRKIWELITVRRILDSEAAALAALSATEKQIRKLRNFKEQADNLGVDNLMVTREGGKLYGEFYNDLYDATNNTIFTHLLKSISIIIRGVLPYSREKLIKVKGSGKAIYDHHIKIVQAIESRDSSLAKELMVIHINYIDKSLQKALKE
ncbi:MAG: FadR family transcriptional regulator [Spirochaetes bacterium]|nr:MAG: FadR family transcriptional regulator [Spirochaetota bacterium]